LQGGREALSAKVLKYHAARQKHHLTLWNKKGDCCSADHRI
jgi:hypothetical protein